MSRTIIIFNIIYYAITIILIKLGIDDPSSSLGYGYFIIIFWIIAAVILLFLIVKKKIVHRSLIDKIGIFTATPIIGIVVISVVLSFKEDVSSERYFNKNNYQYKVRIFDRDETTGGKRIEYYRSADTLNSKETLMSSRWVKDSLWIYLSKEGDTIKKIKYNNDVESK